MENVGTPFMGHGPKRKYIRMVGAHFLDEPMIARIPVLANVSVTGSEYSCKSGIRANW